MRHDQPTTRPTTRGRTRVWTIVSNLAACVVLATLPAAPALAQTCESKLDGVGFNCSFSLSDGQQVSDCLTFYNSRAPGFVVYSQHLDSYMTCVCNPTGKISDPRFESSKTGFECTPGPTCLYCASITGKINTSNRTLKLQTVDADGLTSLASCKPDPNLCPIAVAPLESPPQERTPRAVPHDPR